MRNGALGAPSERIGLPSTCGFPRLGDPGGNVLSAGKGSLLREPDLCAPHGATACGKLLFRCPSKTGLHDNCKFECGAARQRRYRRTQEPATPSQAVWRRVFRCVGTLLARISHHGHGLRHAGRAPRALRARGRATQAVPKPSVGRTARRSPYPW